MLTVHHITKRFKGYHNGHFTALNAVSFHINKGETFGVIGLSGAGKSTLLRTLIGLETPDDGKVLIHGVDLATLNGNQRREFLARIGVVFQGYQLFHQKTVYDNIAFPLRMHHYTEYDTRMRVNELIEWVGLNGKEYSFPSQLSGGQRQRVAIARALALNPELLLLDELTSALDPLTTKQILQLLHDIQQKTKITLFLITHEMAVVRALCTRVAVLDQGRLIETGTVEDLYHRSTSLVTKLLLGEVVIEQ